MVIRPVGIDRGPRGARVVGGFELQYDIAGAVALELAHVPVSRKAGYAITSLPCMAPALDLIILEKR